MTDLNLSKWIDRRKNNIGPHADTIIKGVQEYEERIKKLEENIKVICEEWDSAIQRDIGTGAASISAAAAITFYKRYPSVSSFGETLYGIVFEDENEKQLDDRA